VFYTITYVTKLQKLFAMGFVFAQTRLYIPVLERYLKTRQVKQISLSPSTLWLDTWGNHI